MKVNISRTRNIIEAITWLLVIALAAVFILFATSGCGQWYTAGLGDTKRCYEERDALKKEKAAQAAPAKESKR